MSFKNLPCWVWFVIWFHLQCVLTTLYRPHFLYLTFTCNINATKNIKTFINDLDFHNKILETQYLSNKLLECTVSCHSPCSFIVKHVPVQFNHSCSSFSIIQNTWPRPIKSRQMWNPTPDINHCYWYMKISLLSSQI